jgi:hypothetical protein
MNGIRNAQVLRTGSIASTETTTYYDVLLLDHLFRHVNLNTNEQFESAKPVRPLVRNVAAPVGATLETGATISVYVNPTSMVSAAGLGAYEVLSDAYDVTTVSTGEGCHLLGTSGGGCSAGLTDFGVLID